MLVHETVQYTNINLEHFCKEKDLESCAVKLHLLYYEICIISIYRSPSGNLQYFLHKIDEILNMLYSNTIEIIICGDKLVFPLYRPWRPLGLCEVEAPTFSSQSAQRWR
jgi:hypothetical protein